jgi:DNA-binding LacI/PurR family transcriptional regulator
MLAGVRQHVLAREAGLSEALVSRALRGQRRLSPVVAALAEDLIRERVAEAAQALLTGTDAAARPLDR